MKRIFKWLIFTIGLGLLPTGVTYFIKYITDIHYDNNYIIELLFFSLMICANALSELIELIGKVRLDSFIAIILFVFVFFIVAIGILYGVVSLDIVTNKNIIHKINEIKDITIFICIFSSVIGLILQIMLERSYAL